MKPALGGCFAIGLLAACAHPDPGGAVPARFPDPFHVIAHRGASGHAPENTLPAIWRALELGAFEVELDAQLSRDGEVVLFHDATLDEKTDLRGRVGDHPVARLQRADIGRWFDRTHQKIQKTFAGTTLTTLPEVFETFGAELHYHVELKSAEPELPSRVLEAVGAAGLDRHVTLTSFSMDQLRRARTRDPHVPICLLLPREGDETAQRAAVDSAVALGANQVGVHASRVTPELVAYAHGRGLEIRAWGVHSTDDMERAIAVGTNGMTIDWPELLIEQLVRWKALAPAQRAPGR